MNPDREEDVFSDPEDPFLMRGEQEEEEDEEDARIFNSWMQQYSGGERPKNQEEEEDKEGSVGGRPDSRGSLEPPVQMGSGRRSSLPCPVRNRAKPKALSQSCWI